MANTVRIIKTLSHFRIGSAVVTGVGADTDIACAGIKTSDEIIHLHSVHDTTGVLTDHTDISKISSAGNVQSTASTSGEKVEVMWASKD